MTIIEAVKKVLASKDTDYFIERKRISETIKIKVYPNLWDMMREAKKHNRKICHIDFLEDDWKESNE